MIEESGHSGSLVSLGGIVGVTGRGRKLAAQSIVGAATNFQLLNDNPKRVAAIIQCLSNSPGILTVMLDPGVGGLILFPGASLQIDQNFPWTGPVWIDGAALSTGWCVETSLP